MATAQTSSQPTAGVEGNPENASSTLAVSTWASPPPTLHPEATEILRQIDHYFSDDNLRQDAHLLALFKEGDGVVSLNEVLGFPRMRKFKPRSAVKEVVKQSTVVEVVENGKKLRRRQPLQKSITVVPKLSDDRKKYAVPEDKPWLTKGMMKPTGFEEFATSGPIDPKAYDEDRMEYDPDNAFPERIETAIRKFSARRKMHQETRLIFNKYMTYGGMDCGPGQFTGGVDSRTKEELTKKEIAELTSVYNVSERVLDGFVDEDEGEKPTYVVDFEATAKGFLSSQFQSICNWYDPKQVMTATNVLRNFFNYLLLHDVCPEYNSQLHAARKVCDLAEEELLKLSVVDARLPGGFNKACSALTDGNYAGLHAATGDWAKEGDDIGWTKDDAKLIFMTGIFAYGTEEQLKKVESIKDSGQELTKAIKVVNEEESMGLEVVSVEPANGRALQLYEDVRFTNTIVKKMGKLRCKRWGVPHGKLQDLPDWVIQMRKEEDGFEFLLEDETLKYCYPGMKMEACVKELNLGIKFIDYFEATYVSFFTWLWNERIREHKEPGLPTAWMQRANAQKGVNGSAETGEESSDRVNDEEMPD
jgi:hypothetical protein